MSALKNTVFALAFAWVAVGCATTAHNDVATSADTLASKTQSFAHATESAPGQTPSSDDTYTQDVQALADQARDFSRMASNGAANSDLQAAFNDLSKSYLTVNAEVDRSHNQWTRDTWRSVRAAYVDLENHIHNYG